MKVTRRGDKKPIKKLMGGGMMYKKGGTTKSKMKKKKLAAMYGDPKKITRGEEGRGEERSRFKDQNLYG